MPWTKEEEDALVEAKLRSLQALAVQNGEVLPPLTGRSIAHAMALISLHAKAVEQANQFMRTSILRRRPMLPWRDLGHAWVRLTPEGREIARVCKDEDDPMLDTERKVSADLRLEREGYVEAMTVG